MARKKFSGWCLELLQTIRCFLSFVISFTQNYQTHLSVMTAEDQIKLALKIVNVGYSVGSLPYYIDWKKHGEKPKLLRIKSDVRRMVWFLVSLTHIYIRLGLIGFILIFDNTYKDELDVNLRVQYCFGISVEALSLCLQINTLVFSQRARIVFNAGLMLFPKLRKIHGTDVIFENTITRCLYILYAFPAAVIIACWPACQIFLYDRFGIEDFGAGSILWYLGIVFCTLVSTVFTFGIFVDWIFVIHYCSIALVYCGAVCFSVQKCWWQPHMKKSRTAVLRRLYAAHQILHNLVVKESSLLVGAVLTAGQGISTVGLFSIIVFGQQLFFLDTLAFGATSLLSIIIVNMCLEYAATLTEITEQFPSSYLRDDKRLTKWERKAYNSVQSLSIRAGMIAIGRSTCLHVMSDLLIIPLINLMIASRD